MHGETMTIHGPDGASLAHRLMARLHLRRGAHDGGDGFAEGGGGGAVVPEPGVVLSSRSPASAKMRLVPLAEAQGRADIANRPEGFEMAEARLRPGMP